MRTIKSSNICVFVETQVCPLDACLASGLIVDAKAVKNPLF